MLCCSCCIFFPPLRVCSGFSRIWNEGIFFLYLPNWLHLKPSGKQLLCGKFPSKNAFGVVGLHWIYWESTLKSLKCCAGLFYVNTATSMIWYSILSAFIARFATFHLHNIHTPMAKTKLGQVCPYFIIDRDITFNSQVTNREYTQNDFTIIDRTESASGHQRF